MIFTEGKFSSKLSINLSIFLHRSDKRKITFTELKYQKKFSDKNAKSYLFIYIILYLLT